MNLNNQKILYFRHYVHGRKLQDDMNKSYERDFGYRLKTMHAEEEKTSGLYFSQNSGL